ncbi:MAG: hypothetical protein Q8K85_23365 [Hyphomicrobium sp.]|nr:hypothetical protein [Hyphomicrobium sp.]
MLGRQPTSGELYIAHFLGANGAKRLLSLRATNPNASAVAAFPEAARANKSIFYNSSGPRSVEETYRGLVAKHDNLRNAAPATAVANLHITNPPAAYENSSPIPNLLNRIAAIFLPRKTAPANAIQPVRQMNVPNSTAFTPRVTAQTRTITAQAPVPNVTPQTVAVLNNPPAVQNDAPIFRGLFQNDTATPLSQDVRSLWGGVNPFLRRTT